MCISTLIVNNSEVEIVDSFKFLGIHITSNLSWSLQARYMCKKGQQRLYFLRCLKKFHMKPEILVNFYRSIIESISFNELLQKCDEVEIIVTQEQSKCGRRPLRHRAQTNCDFAFGLGE